MVVPEIPELEEYRESLIILTPFWSIHNHMNEKTGES